MNNLNAITKQINKLHQYNIVLNNTYTHWANPGRAYVPLPPAVRNFFNRYKQVIAMGLR